MKAIRIVNIYSYKGSRRHRDIGIHPEITNSFRSSRSWDNVDRYGVGRNGRKSPKKSMNKPQNDEKEKRKSEIIPKKCSDKKS
jgi:hypothetical protein